jgi:hypothetical protein
MTEMENTSIVNINDIITTDHKMLTFSFWTEDICSVPLIFNTKKEKIYKNKFQYEEMTKEEWLEYTNIQNEFLTNIDMDTSIEGNPQLYIEKHWSQYKEGIEKSQKKIKQEKIQINKSKQNPYTTPESYQGRQFLLTFYKKLKKRKGRKQNLDNWPTNRGFLIKYSKGKITTSWSALAPFPTNINNLKIKVNEFATNI